MACLQELTILICMSMYIILHGSSATILSPPPKASMDIHMEIQSNGNQVNSNPPDLKEIIHQEITSALSDLRPGLECRNSPSSHDSNDNSPITVRYAEHDLDKITTELQAIKNVLKGFSVNADSLAISSIQKKSLGVQYNNFKNILINDTPYPKNCKEVYQNGNNVSGVYVIHPKYARAPFPVLCDMETRGGGWIHIQKRFDGSQDFSLKWRDYKFGFGDLDGEFWLGLENIHLLTDFDLTELLVEIVDRDNISAYAQYNSFAVGPEPGGYKLNKLSGYSGDAGDSLKDHNENQFSTSDLDFTGCNNKFYGGWWYFRTGGCTKANLNGKYINIDLTSLPSEFNYKGLHWDSFRDAKYSHSKSRMLIRPVH